MLILVMTEIVNFMTINWTGGNLRRVYFLELVMYFMNGELRKQLTGSLNS